IKIAGKSLNVAGGNVQIVADASFLTQSPPPGVITVSCSDQSCPAQTIPVTFDVTPPPPILSVNITGITPVSLQEGASGSLSFSVSNSGPTPGNFNVATVSNGNWLKAAPSSGTAFQGSTIPITLLISAQTLTANNYTGQVTVTGDGGLSQSFSINLT